MRLLKHAHVPGPYVLVGQSIAGWDVRLFTSYYPHQVAGMVLSDAAAPDVYTRLAPIVPANRRAKVDALVLGAPQRMERLNVSKSAAQVAAVHSVGRIPLIVISHGVFSFPWSGQIAVTTKERTKFDSIWSKMQNDLTHLSPNSIHVVAVGSGHGINTQNPELELQAIDDVVIAARTSPHRLPACGTDLTVLGAVCVSSPKSNL